MSEDNHEKHDGDFGNLNLNPFKDMLDTVVNWTYVNTLDKKS